MNAFLFALWSVLFGAVLACAFVLFCVWLSERE